MVRTPPLLLLRAGAAFAAAVLLGLAWMAGLSGPVGQTALGLALALQITLFLSFLPAFTNIRRKPSIPRHLVDADCLSEALVKADDSGKILFLNRAASCLFEGRTDAPTINSLFDDLHRQCSDPAFAAQVIEAVQAAPDLRYTDMLALRDGRTFERSTRPVESTGNRIWIVRDVTHVQRAGQDSAMHQSMVEADAARTAELAEQLYLAKAELEENQAELTRLANTDALTGLYNRRRFTALGKQAVAAAGPDRAVWVLMMDIDFFKRINDTYGHGAGDMVIREFGQLIASAAEGLGFAGRMGGEEFAVVLTDTDADTAFRIGEHIRREGAGLTVMSGRDRISFTASVGIADWQDGETTIEAALDRADRALYSAKSYGRNRVVGFEMAAAE